MRVARKASVLFGQIAIPVGLVPAFAKGEIELVSLCREHEVPVTAPRWCATHERALEPTEIVKAHQLDDGQYVILEDEEREAIAADAEARTIEIFAFVEQGQLEPLLQGERSYYLAPGKQQLMRRAYGLLSAGMRESGLIGLARYTGWGKENVYALEHRRSAEKTLVLRLLRFPEDLELFPELEEQLAGTEPSDEERQLAVELADSMVAPLGKLDLVDHDRKRLATLIEAKLAGGEIVRPKARTQPGAVPTPADLAGALRASLKARPKKRGAQAARSKSRSSSRVKSRS